MRALVIGAGHGKRARDAFEGAAIPGATSHVSVDGLSAAQAKETLRRERFHVVLAVGPRMGLDGATGGARTSEGLETERYQRGGYPVWWAPEEGKPAERIEPAGELAPRRVHRKGAGCAA